MSNRTITALLVLAAGAALVVAYLLPPRVGHPVTPFMESAAEDISGRAVSGLSVRADRPTVVVFVLPDCPCSEAFAPHVARLHRAYGEWATFVDVVAGDGRAAEDWKQRHYVDYRTTADSDGKTAREFGAMS